MRLCYRIFLFIIGLFLSFIYYRKENTPTDRTYCQLGSIIFQLIQIDFFRNENLHKNSFSIIHDVSFPYHNQSLNSNLKNKIIKISIQFYVSVSFSMKLRLFAPLRLSIVEFSHFSDFKLKKLHLLLLFSIDLPPFDTYSYQWLGNWQRFVTCSDANYIYIIFHWLSAFYSDILFFLEQD